MHVLAPPFSGCIGSSHRRGMNGDGNKGGRQRGNHTMCLPTPHICGGPALNWAQRQGPKSRYRTGSGSDRLRAGQGWFRGEVGPGELTSPGTEDAANYRTNRGGSRSDQGHWPSMATGNTAAREGEQVWGEAGGTIAVKGCGWCEGGLRPSQWPCCRAISTGGSRHPELGCWAR